MSDCETHIETHRMSGRTQLNRMPKALGTEFIKIDERGIEDLIVATNKLSIHLNFYSNENVVLGNWSSFFGWESTSILAQIAAIDIQKLISDFKSNRRKLILVSADKHHDIVKTYFESVDALLKDVFQKINQLPGDLAIKNYFESTVETVSLLLQGIVTQINASEDLNVTFQNHLFNKKTQNIFGLLTDWKTQSEKQLHKNLESYAKHSPQYALYITFLQLFKNAQNDLNSFTKRHLDFYYKNVLHLEPQEATSDFVHCCIEPHKQISPFLIQKDSIFLAGKDKEGNRKYYASTADAAINSAKINTIYGGLIKDSHYHFNDLTQNNAQGESWKTFTESTEKEELGFAMASPLFFLKGGIRAINIEFKKLDAIQEIDVSKFHFYLSGEEEWFQIKTFNNVGGKLQLNLTSEDPSIVPFNSEIHNGVVIDTVFPILKIVAKNAELTKFRFNQINIDVSVDNYKQFKLFSDTGTIDHTKSFEPFGLVPKNGHSITFSSKEFSMKKGAKGNLDITAEDDNSSIEVDKTWSIYDNTKLMELNNGQWSFVSDWELGEHLHLNNKGDITPDFTEDEALTPSKTNGYFKIILSSDDFKGEAYLNEFIKESKEDDPNLPYIPTINDVRLHYSATSKDDVEVSFYNIYPKGYKKVVENWNIIPLIKNEGELFIGVKDIEPGNSLSLLFQVAEGSANPRQLPIDLTWSYLKGNTWETFKSEAIGDETNGLTQSGIVQIQAPEDLNIEDQTIFPKGIWWLKIEVLERVDAICHLVGIHTQALKAVLFDYDNNGLEFKENLEPDVISKLFKPKNEIKKIIQPYMSFYGRLKDTDELFYQRSSERLRHKEKAISIWDYETLILDNFSEVFRVKCLNHYRYDATEINNSSAGYVTIIPIAKGLDTNVPVYWKPIVPIGTMKRIKTFLESKSSPHARIIVKPPTLEKLELEFKFKHHDSPGADSRLYAQQLIDVINKFLSPWAYNTNSNIEFQSEIEKSKLIQIIEMQSFVDYISDFKVNHLILDETTGNTKRSFNDVKKIVPKTVYSLFVPHTHSITNINTICCL